MGPGIGFCPASWRTFCWSDNLHGLVSGRYLVSTRPEARGFGDAGADFSAAHRHGTRRQRQND